mgnify:FL=1
MVPFTFEVARIVSIAAFLFFGITCLTSPHMVDEFKRYRLARFRKPIGILQLLGSAGLMAGFASPALLIISAAGLTVLMLLGIVTRIRIGDSFLETLPASIFFVVNGFILLIAVQQN